MKVPRPRPESVHWMIDVFDESGRLLESRFANEEEQDYLVRFPADGFNTWAKKKLTDNRRMITEIFPDYRPGTWRGKPNKYSNLTL